MLLCAAPFADPLRALQSSQRGSAALWLPHGARGSANSCCECAVCCGDRGSGGALKPALQPLSIVSLLPGRSVVVLLQQHPLQSSRSNMQTLAASTAQTRACQWTDMRCAGLLGVWGICRRLRARQREGGRPAGLQSRGLGRGTSSMTHCAREASGHPLKSRGLRLCAGRHLAAARRRRRRSSPAAATVAQPPKLPPAAGPPAAGPTAQWCSTAAWPWCRAPRAAPSPSSLRRRWPPRRSRLALAAPRWRWPRPTSPVTCSRCAGAAGSWPAANAQHPAGCAHRQPPAPRPGPARASRSPRLGQPQTCDTAVVSIPTQANFPELNEEGALEIIIIKVGCLAV